MAHRTPLAYRALQQIGWWLILLLTRIDVVGVENIPPDGPLIVAPNHIHVLDLPVDFVVVPRRPTVFAADKWRNKVGGWIMKLVANTIFVARGEADRKALGKAMAVLKTGGTLAIAPEGTRSRTGGLLPGKNGAVYLASRAGVPILPIVAWGQERALGAWAHLRRPDIHVRIAPPIVFPPEAKRAKGEELDKYTEQLMLTLARMLPPEYRGAYADRFAGEAH
jgi:1-acyl-sn-glycerol-3-phosphate acyltransferase